MQYERESFHMASLVIGDKEDGAESILERIFQPGGKLDDIILFQGLKLFPKNSLNLYDGFPVNGKRIVVNATYAKQSVCFPSV